jgi:hypothetical protein
VENAWRHGSPAPHLECGRGRRQIRCNDSGAACGYRIECKWIHRSGLERWAGGVRVTRLRTASPSKGTQEEVLRLAHYGRSPHAQARTSGERTPRSLRKASSFRADARGKAEGASLPIPRRPRAAEHHAHAGGTKPAFDLQPRSAPPPHVEPKAKQRRSLTTRHARRARLGVGCQSQGELTQSCARSPRRSRRECTQGR